MLPITRLWFDRNNGQAHHKGVSVELTNPPQISEHCVEIDYAPGLRAYRIRESAQGWRDMVHAEIERAQGMLDRMAAAAQNELTK